MKGLESSPTSGFRKLLSKRVKVIDVPERNTTKTCSKCHGLLVPDKTRLSKTKQGKLVPCRGIRRCNNAIHGGLLRWNRDHNAAINIRSNLIHYINHNEWNPTFSSISQQARSSSMMNEQR